MELVEVLIGCPCCGKEHSVVVQNEDLIKWQTGTLAQKAFPYLSTAEKEQLISGLCLKCQEDIFGEEDDLYTGEADYDEAMAESLAFTGQWW